MELKRKKLFASRRALRDRKLRKHRTGGLSLVANYMQIKSYDEAFQKIKIRTSRRGFKLIKTDFAPPSKSRKATGAKLRSTKKNGRFLSVSPPPPASRPGGVIIFIISCYQKGHFSKRDRRKGICYNGPCKQFQVCTTTSVNFENYE